MATLTFSLSSTALTGSKSYTLSDADVQRWLDALRVWFPSKVVDADGNIIPSTNAQLLVAWANSVVGDSKRVVKDVETKAAASNIVDISAT